MPELSTEDWVRVIEESEPLGAMQINLSGGEPLLRPDLEAIVAAARKKEIYSNLITSGIGLSESRMDSLIKSGIDGVQISFQDADGNVSKRIAGKNTFADKLFAARAVRSRGLPLTINVVLHRANIAQVQDIIDLAEGLGAIRLELANAQYLGWALVNRDSLLPDRASLDLARQTVLEAKARLLGKLEILFVLPDYYSDRPKACMDGWADRYLVINPYGMALPCHAAMDLPGLEFDNVREKSLESIWMHSQGLNAFRGEAWMPEPCRTCDQREKDFGGCRCQAYQLTGMASNADPACSLSPHHQSVKMARAKSETAENERDLVYRNIPFRKLASNQNEA
jgi:PqqA peptide cyclase